MSRKNEVTDNIDNIAGIRIQTLRITKGWSRKQLASKIGVSHQQLQKYEKGTNRIAFGRICLIAKALGKSITYFEEDSETIKEEIATQHQRMAMEISRNFMKITSLTNQYAVNQMVKILAENK